LHWAAIGNYPDYRHIYFAAWVLGLRTAVIGDGFGHIKQSLILRLTQPPLQPLRIEAANNAFSNDRCFSRIVGLSHAHRETRQFLSGEFSLGVELIGKSNNARLISSMICSAVMYRR
jgi:hypothetical protein